MDREDRGSPESATLLCGSVAHNYNTTAEGFSAQFAQVVETRLLPLWDQERDRLSRTGPPESRKAEARRLMTYMTLRSQGWKLIGEGLRANDAGLRQRGRAKQEEALDVIRQR